MAKHQSLLKAKQLFLDYYLQLLPQFVSTAQIDAYLSTRNPQVILVSPYHEDKIKKLWQKQKLTWTPLAWFPHTLLWPENADLGQSLPGFTQGWLYPLNPSSLLPILALDPKPSDAILDASAAPGGKTIAMANYLFPHSPNIVANDVSRPRFKRLCTALKLFGYPQIATLSSPIQTLSQKLNKSFTKILLDAPCSSEKHVYNSKFHLKIWSPKRINTLCQLQSVLIKSLLPFLGSNGRLIYSTCALAPAENEDTANKILSKQPRQYPNL